MKELALSPSTTAKKNVLSKAVINTADNLGFTKNKLSKVLGLSPATVTRLYARSYDLSPRKKEWDYGVLLVRLFRSLDALVGGSHEDARAWMNSENKGLADQKPANLVETTEGLVSVVHYLDTCRGII
ncbi:MAG: antitoxin Xre/MbcA/ParS toxin-binding domain-containing protein [Syntrophaceae bacterium]